MPREGTIAIVIPQPWPQIGGNCIKTPPRRGGREVRGLPLTAGDARIGAIISCGDEDDGINGFRVYPKLTHKFFFGSWAFQISVREGSQGSTTGGPCH